MINESTKVKKVLGEDIPSLSPSYVNNQLQFFAGCDVTPYFDEAVLRSQRCFDAIENKYYQTDRINVLHTGQYATFLYWLSRVAFEGGDEVVASKVYYLNKMLNGFDIFYEVKMPNIFFMEHPVGTVLGRAKYSDKLFVGQNVTVGGNKGKYPTIGKNVTLHTGSIVVGDTVIGDNVEVSAGSFIRDESIPDNCLVFGESPNLVVKVRSCEEMMERLAVSEFRR